MDKLKTIWKRRISYSSFLRVAPSLVGAGGIGIVLIFLLAKSMVQSGSYLLGIISILIVLLCMSALLFYILSYLIFPEEIRSDGILFSSQNIFAKKHRKILKWDEIKSISLDRFSATDRYNDVILRVHSKEGKIYNVNLFQSSDNSSIQMFEQKTLPYLQSVSAFSNNLKEER